LNEDLPGLNWQLEEDIMTKILHVMVLSLAAGIALADDCEAGYDATSGNVTIPCLRMPGQKGLLGVQLQSKGNLDYHVASWFTSDFTGNHNAPQVDAAGAKVVLSPIPYAQMQLTLGGCTQFKSVAEQSNYGSNVIDLTVEGQINTFAEPLVCATYIYYKNINVALNSLSSLPKGSYQLRINGLTGPSFDWPGSTQ
jgi:hypothetical protein